MGFTLPNPTQRRILALVPALLVVLVGALAYERAQTVVTAARQVDRSNAIIQSSGALLARTVDAETGQRAYLLTGDETFLDPYRGARDDINRYVDSLRVLTRTDPGQAARLSAIERLIPIRFGFLDGGIARRRAGLMAGAVNNDTLLAGKRAMDQFRTAVTNLQAHEQSVITERRAAEQRDVRSASISIGVAAIIALVLSALINLAFTRAVHERETANTELRKLNEDLETQSGLLETQTVEMESQAAELEATAEDLRSTNEALARESRAAAASRDAAEKSRSELEQLLEKRKREEQGALLLSEASRVLASTLDYEKTLETVARLAVGELAEWCAVDLLDPAGSIRQVVVAHVDEKKVQWARELNKRYPPDHSGPSGVGNAIRTGQPQIYADITDEMLVASARDPEHLKIMRELQIKSAIIVPMIARGRTLGALTLISSQRGRRYGDNELALAMELATRAAIAIDNAQLYRGALAASAAKSAFLATISHELRTPLNAIIGYQALLGEGIYGPLSEEQLAQLGRIRSGADHLLGLIDEVLTFSRVEAGKEVVRQDEVKLRPSAEEALVMVTPLAEAKGLDLTADVPDAQLFTDGDKLRQVLVNLLSNSVKFTDRGEIRLSARETEGLVEFQVTDTGIGIAPENLERIFEPFWQVEQSSTRRAGGTGLGLSVSRSLARLMGGDVTVQSELGKGSTFTLTLPVRPA